MVIQLYPQVVTDIGQLGGTNIPGGAGQLDGADKLLEGSVDLMGVTTGIEHPLIKGSIVGGNEVRILNGLVNGGPQLTKVELVRHILPADVMDVGEFKLLPRRTNQMIDPIYNLIVFYADETDRTGTVRASIRSFKI